MSLKTNACAGPAGRVLFALCLALSGAGCSLFGAAKPAENFEPTVSVSPRPEVNPGGSVTITVDSKRPPDGLVYRWSVPAGLGLCEPSNSSVARTVYRAPPQLSGERDTPVPVSVEFVVDGTIIGTKMVSVVVKAGGAQTAQSPTPAETPPPQSNPTVEITQIPPYSLGGPEGMFPIAGKVSGVPLSGYRVVLYAQTDLWYVQPFSTGDVRFTPLDSNGMFSNQTHGGIKYAALLVKDSYTDPPGKTDRLPEIGKDVVAISIIQGGR